MEYRNLLEAERLYHPPTKGSSKGLRISQEKSQSPQSGADFPTDDYPAVTEFHVSCVAIPSKRGRFSD